MELIPAENIFYILLPLAIVWYFYYSWTDNKTEIPYATLRMLVQLLGVGYVLIYIFENDSWYSGLFIIFIMISMSSFIAFRNISNKTLYTYLILFTSIMISGTLTLFIVIEFVLELTPFYQPKYVIPIAGMVYANSMNAISIAAERFEKEIKTLNYTQARAVSLKASIIPNINTFLAVGLVSLPGMMTGQILSGVTPLIAVRYQIVIMSMILGSAGISVIIYLLLQKNSHKAKS